MKSIPTVYHGYRFRSRLEARWAVFFDTVGVVWEYEPEGFDLGSSVWYLPDFKLHNVTRRGQEEASDLWVEVKGVLDDESLQKVSRFAYGGDDYSDRIQNPIFIVMNIPGPDLFWSPEYENSSSFSFNYWSVDGDDFEALLCVNRHGVLALCDTGEQYGNIDQAKTVAAYERARNYDFRGDSK